MGLGDNELGDNGVGDNGVGDRPLGDNDTESFFLELFLEIRSPINSTYTKDSLVSK